jgi:hypothetical protein
VDVLSLVLAQEEIAECGAAILVAVMVIPRPATDHKRHIARGQHFGQASVLAQSETARTQCE